MDKNSDGESNNNSLISRMALNDNKAGMQGLDKEKINKVIMENTLGSRFYKNEQKRDAQVKQRIAKMKASLQSYSLSERESALRNADKLVEEIERNRDLTRTIIHIDMDAFYASVEERDMPELKLKPMAVGGMDMLSTSNYNARKFGVRAAMPGFIAMKLCPDLVIVPLNFSKYKKVSKEIQEIYAEYDENFMAASLDEAYIDITDHLQQRHYFAENQRTFNYNPDLLKSITAAQNSSSVNSRTFGFNSEEVAEEIRFRIHQKTKLTASAGVAPNLMLAKIGSDFNKPNGQTHIPPDRGAILKFVKDLSIRKVSGIGKVSEQLLSALGIKTCHDLYKQRDDLILCFSEVSSSFFLRASLGCSSNTIQQIQDRKSISTERTFNSISRPEELFAKLSELCESLIEDLKKGNLHGKTVTLKTKSIDFELHTRSKSAGRPLSSFDDIFSIAKELLKQEISLSNNKLTLRLMGVGLSKLEGMTGANQSSIKKFFTKNQKPDPTSDVIEPTSDVIESDAHQCLNEEKDIVADEYNSVDVKDPAMCDEPAEEEKSPILLPDNNPPCDADSSSNISCPVCSNMYTNLHELNRHLDHCLIPASQPSHSERTSGDQNLPEEPPQPSNKSKRNANNDDLGSVYACPICSIVFDSTNITLSYFNTHVDSCLNRNKIKEILRSDTPATSQVKTVSPVKKSLKRRKRRKIINAPSKTIDKFFS